MIYGIKFVSKYLLGMDYAGRNFPIFPDDTMLVSYPRSGNTWTRFLIANLLHPSQAVDFLNIEELVPDTTTVSTRALKRTPRPRFIKTHEYFDPRYPKVIYVVRDPRDVVLSCYNFQRKYRQIADGYPIDRYVDDFVEGRATERAWGTWGENVASWVSARGDAKSFLLVQYADMIRDTCAELKRVSQFLGVAISDEIVARAAARSSADSMRELERQQQDRWVGAKKHRKDVPFVGTAKAGEWRTRLPESGVRKIEAAWGTLMSWLGYELVTSSSSNEKVPDASC